MSLKDRLKNDRLNNENKPDLLKATPQVNAKDTQPQYYESSEVANSESSLDVIDIMLSDDELNSICVNGAKNIFIEKKGKFHKSSSCFADDSKLENIIRKIAFNNSYGADKNYIKFNYEKGVNISATLPPLSNNIILFIKCYKDKFANMQVLQDENSLSKEIALFLEAIATMKCNIVIAGEKNSLKTTLLSSLIKKTTANARNVLIDNLNEIELKNTNLLSFDMSKTDNSELKKELLETIINSKPDKLFVDVSDSEAQSYILRRVLEGFSGCSFTLEAASKEKTLEKIVSFLTNENNLSNLNQIKSQIAKNINLIIFTKLDNNRRLVCSISQIKLDENNNLTLEDIFYLNDVKYHQSNDIIPQFLKEANNSASCLNLNIFDKNYTHTYSAFIAQEEEQSTNDSSLEMLKKLKKEYSQNQDEEVVKKVQEKFNKLRKNIQSNAQEQINSNQDDNN